MLPFGGQGSNQAIEDAGALGFLFKDLENSLGIPRRLEMFDTVRRKRASRVQILSKVRVGKEQDVKHELLAYADPPGSGKPSSDRRAHRLVLMMVPEVPESFAERNAHDYG